MTVTVFKKLFSTLLTVAFVLLLVLAVYVSLGRQLLPYVGNYHSDIETQLSAQLGQEVKIGSIAGTWRRFNPILSLHDVAISAPLDDSGQPVLFLDTLTLELSTWASLLDWRWHLSSIDIANPELTLQEGDDGRWQLHGFENGAQQGLSPEQMLDMVARVNELTLSNMRLTLRRADGHSRSFERSRLQVHSRGAQHYLHLDVWQHDVIGPLSLAAELRGEQLADLQGRAYLHIPESDYSSLLAAQYTDTLALKRFAGSGEIWLSIAKGQLQSVQGSVDLSELAWSMPTQFALDELSTQFYLQRQDADWDLWLESLAFSWNGLQWQESTLFASVIDTENFNLSADRFNLTIATDMLAHSKILGPDEHAQLTEHNPRGELLNFDLEYRFANAGGADALASDQLRVVANLSDVAVSARGGAPAIWGIDGYTELSFDSGSKKLTGFADVDSRRLMFQLPMMFDDAWMYDYVNGRVSIDLDLSAGQNLRLSSGVIVAESAEATGRAQFSLFTAQANGETSAADLELKVGITQGDISKKSIYLPTAPNVKDGMRNVMHWLDEAIVAGAAADSGLLFRGSVLSGSAPVQRTLQMYFNVHDGILRFDPQWPVLDSLEGFVVIDDGSVDINVSSGESLGVALDATSAAIRPNQNGSGNLLTVTGNGAGGAAQALQYLQETPVTRGFGEYIADWRGEGDVGLALELLIPLGAPDTVPEVNVALQLSANALSIPEFDLNFDAINGQLHYNTRTGLLGQGVAATLFGEEVAVDIRSTLDDTRATHTQVAINGSVGVEALRTWPRQSDFVVDLLGRVSGKMEYQALLEVSQASEDEGATRADLSTQRLTLNSTLQGVDLHYPVPFKKLADTAVPMRITVDFFEDAQDVRVSLTDIVSANIGISTGQIRNGLVFLGKQDEGVSIRRLNASAPGLDVLGVLPRFDYGEWVQALRSTDVATSSVGSKQGFSNLRAVLNAVDVTIADAYAFGQHVQALNLQITSEPQHWQIALASETVRGEVRVPYSAGAPLKLDLAHLRLPAVERSPLSASLEPLVGPPAPDSPYWDYKRVDILANLDPRDFPLMSFKADEVYVGDAPYGSWQFTLEPNAGGAVFSDLLFETRGIRAGKEGEEGRVVWAFDGIEHHSYFSSVLEADDLGVVLSNFGYAPSLESSSAQFHASLDWPGSPAFFAVDALNGDLDLRIRDGRFLQSSAGAANGALKLISIINFDALVRRLRFSDDLLRRGLAYEQIYGSMTIDDGIVDIVNRLQIIGPASLFQVAGQLDLERQTIDGSLFITLPVSDNIPWLSGIAVLNNIINWQVAVGVFLFDQIFGDQVDSLTSAQYTLRGPWEGLEPKLNQVFGTPGAPATAPRSRTSPAPTAPAVSR